MPRTVDDNPATRKKGWLPEGIRPEIDAMRETHHELIDRLDEAKAHRDQIVRGFEQEDKERVEAFRRDEDPAQVTPEVERNEARQEARARVKAAQEALADFVDETVEAFQENESTYTSDLTSAAVAAKDRREEARRVLAEAEKELAVIEQRKAWITRTAENRYGWHISADALPLPRRDQTGEEKFDALVGAMSGE